MVDFSKHLARAKQALDKNNTEMVFETLGECLELEPSNLELHKMWLDAAKRRAKLGGKSGMFSGLSGGFGGMMGGMSKDLGKQVVAQVKRLAKTYDNKVLFDCGEAAQKAMATLKPMLEVAILYYEDIRASGMFHDKALWNLGHAYLERFRATGSKDEVTMDLALRTMRELIKAMPNHPEASRTLNNWEAMKSMLKRNSAGAATDYRSQLANDTGARKAEMMNRLIRTPDDAQEVMRYVAEELKVSPNDKALWMKQGKIMARYGSADHARASFTRVIEIDPHDFLATVELAELDLAVLRLTVERASAAGGDASAEKKALLAAEIQELRRRCERQPTDMGHRYQLGQRLIQNGDIDAAAGEFQRTVSDPKHKRSSLRLLGWCFAKKNLLELARQQYDSYLAMVEDDGADEAKEVRYLRARVLEGLGRRDDAITDFNRLVAIDLGYRDAAQRLATLQGG